MPKRKAEAIEPPETEAEAIEPPPEKKAAKALLSPNEERKDINVKLVNEVLATLKLKLLSEDEIYDLTNKLNESIFELVDIRTFLIRHLIPYRVNKIIPGLLKKAQDKIDHGIPDSPERAAPRTESSPDPSSHRKQPHCRSTCLGEKRASRNGTAWCPCGGSSRTESRSRLTGPPVQAPRHWRSSRLGAFSL